MKSDISAILKEAYRITFKNKWLWVFGLVLAVGSSSFNSSFNSNRSKDKDTNNSTNSTKILENQRNSPSFPQPNELLEKTSKVLGAATVSTETLVKSISPIFLFTTALVILTAVVIFFGIGLYIRGWATSSLIHGIDQENSGVTLGLTEMSRMGKMQVGQMARLLFFPNFIATLLSVLISIPILVLIILDPTRIIGVLLAILALLVFITVVLVVSCASYLGTFALVLKNKNWKEAYHEGYRILKKYLLDVLALGCVNFMAGIAVMIASCVLFIPLGLIGIGGVIGAMAAPTIIIAVLPIAVIVFLITISAVSLVGAIFVVFNQSTWVLLYKQLISLEESKTI